MVEDPYWERQTIKTQGRRYSEPYLQRGMALQEKQATIPTTAPKVWLKDFAKGKRQSIKKSTKGDPFIKWVLSVHEDGKAERICSVPRAASLTQPFKFLRFLEGSLE